MSFDDRIIDEFRDNGGAAGGGFGTDLVLLHSVGARTGAARVHPLMALRDGDGWLVAASKGGAPEHPAWLHNLIAQPDTTIEVPDQRGGIDTIQVRADVLPALDRDAAWARFVDRSPGFAQYEASAGDRVIPVVRLSPR